MKRLVAAVVLAVTGARAGAAGSQAVAARPARARCDQEAQQVEIIRDSWGIAHIYGHSDADAVFGTIYAQAEDDFRRIERNYIVSLGRLAEAKGESAIYNDLRQRLFINDRYLRAQYRWSPPWLKALLVAWADGLNCYLAEHPRAVPRVIWHYSPWMGLSFTEGSIGGDIDSVDLHELAAFYGGQPLPAERRPPGKDAAALSAPGGSNGFAIAPSRSLSGHALLWINPHTSFYFRAELQMTSDEGLDAYGAVTWGQFFVYQGFNAHNGWMHTSYGGDAVDEYAERIIRKHGAVYYRYSGGLRRLHASRIRIRYLRGARLATRTFTVYRSHHGPIVRAAGGRWIAVKMLIDPVPALEQAYLRTKTVDYASFRQTQDMRTDTTNNTVYADGDGTIAYFHGNFIPRRDPRFDYTHPVDGSNPATEWQGRHTLAQTITLLNPPNGWIQNTNDWPFSAAGADSPNIGDYPRYMWTTRENPRGIHAVQLLQNIHAVNLTTLIAIGYDSRLSAFDVLLPPLLQAYDRLPTDDPRHAQLQGPIAALTSWDRRTGVASVATTLAIFWGQNLMDLKAAAAQAVDEPVYDYLVGHVTDDDRLDALASAVAALQRDFGRWQTPWGDVNRFQRLNDDIVQSFDDDLPSLPVGFAPSKWGALASFDSDEPRTTKKIYGTEGNSFVAAVEFGPVVRAKAIMTGGESGDPASPHFEDQALMYTQGKFRDVLFMRDDVLADAVQRYHPGAPPAAPPGTTPLAPAGEIPAATEPGP